MDILIKIVIQCRTRILSSHTRIRIEGIRTKNNPIKGTVSEEMNEIVVKANGDVNFW